MEKLPSSLGNRLIRAYQNHISEALGEEREYVCKYEPSCSHYTQDAIKEFGLFNGGLMGFMRMMRCHKDAEGGYDPVVPEDNGCLEHDFIPIHKNYEFIPAEKIMSYPSSIQPVKTKPGKYETEPHSISEYAASVFKSSISRACALTGGIAGGAVFSVLGAGIGTWLGTEAGLDRIDAVNKKIAEKYSPESVYGFGKIENSVGKPSFLINRFIAEETGSKTAASIVGGIIGGPVGLVLGLVRGFHKGMQTGSQYGRLFGQSITRSENHEEINKSGNANVSVKDNSLLKVPYIDEKPVFISGGTKLTPLLNDEIGKGSMELIRQAKNSIDLEMFSIGENKLVDALKEKLKEGIKVRIINNRTGRNSKEIGVHNKAIESLKALGAQIIEYPLIESLWQFNHTKLLIVDDKASIVGSKNWTANDQIDHNFDIAFYIEGDSVDEARRVFEKDWSISGGKANNIIHTDESPSVRLYANEPFHYDAADNILKSIKEAEQSMDVGMYWLTDKKIINELIKASQERKVKIRILLSASEENRYAKEKLEKAGIEVKIFTPPEKESQHDAIYHTKMAIFDNKKVVAGSCDWTTQALYLNHELNISVEDQKTAEYLKQAFEKDWNSHAGKDSPFAKKFEMHGMAKINELNRKISQMLPASIARTGMMFLSMLSVSKRLFNTNNQVNCKTDNSDQFINKKVPDNLNESVIINQYRNNSNS